MTYIPFFYELRLFSGLWRFRSAKDGAWETLEKLEVPKGSVIMSEDAVMLLSEGKDLIGQSVYSTYDSTEIRVAGIMKPIKNAEQYATLSGTLGFLWK